MNSTEVGTLTYICNGNTEIAKKWMIVKSFFITTVCFRLIDLNVYHFGHLRLSS